MFCRHTVLKNNVFQLILSFRDLKFNNNDKKDYKEFCLMIIAVCHRSRTIGKAARLTTYIYVNVIVLSIVFINDDARNSRLGPGGRLRE